MIETANRKSSDDLADRAAITNQTINIIVELARELRASRIGAIAATTDSDLDRDLGFDSLGRAELILRLDRAFKVRLPDRLIADARTPADLVEAILAADPSSSEATLAQMARPEVLATIAPPTTARTLIDALQHHVQAHPNRPHVGIWQGDRIGEQFDYGDLHQNALRVARGLRQAGLEAGGRVAIMLPTGQNFFYTFFGILYAGGVPVPIYPPFRRAQVEDHIRRQAGILNNAEVDILVTEQEILRVGSLLKGLVMSLRQVVTTDSLKIGSGPLEKPHPAASDTVALIQYTSGSTGDPKGVVLTHANLLANIRAMGTALEATSKDVFVSWLPLYHDMGLIGAWLGSLYFGARVVIMSPLTFLGDPLRWLRAISQQRGTLSAAPNFAFELCMKNLREEELSTLDLSCLRAVVNGAEPISPGTIRRFTERFVPCGFRPESLEPVYGLAESSVGLAFPPLGRTPPIDRVDRAELTNSGVARPAQPDDSTTMEFVACGRPLTDHQVRIVDEMGLELPERHQGRLQFKGPSTTDGYFRNEEKTRELFSGDWLESGDLAYIASGDIYLTGRVKDMIIRAGRNIYPHEVEEFVGELDGIRKGCVVAFASADPHSGSERLVIAAETRLQTDEDLMVLEKTIRNATLDILDLPPDEIVLVPPQTVPKTSSGKIRRSAAKALFEADALRREPQSLWWQIARLELTGLTNIFQRYTRSALVVCYAAYWWLVLSVLALFVWPAVMLLPRRAWRHAMIAKATRLWFWLSGIRLDVIGSPPTDVERSIVVSNHASYVDGAVLSVAVPGELSFIAKQEFARQFFAGGFLRRLGTLFVHRVDKAAGIKGAEAIVDAAKAGNRLVVFPEGTLLRRPGLLGFRMGAFVAAVEAGAAIVPVAIRGTRTVLRGEQWVPRRGNIIVEIGAPIYPIGKGFHAAVQLRDATRSWILMHCGEVNLTEETVDLSNWEQL
ncbi:MAG: AMP-binding protein [Hyphomicrobiaceae bacterium]